MSYSGVYVFGDSLVDAGNALKLAQFYGTLPFSDLPDGAPTGELGYLQGRFSNGFTIADLLSNKYAGAVTKPVFPFHYEDPWIGIPIDPFAGDPNGNNLNFAYGGAQIRQGDEVVPDLDGQTDAFEDAVDNHADPSALYVVTIGGNDVRSLAPAGSAPTSQATAYAALDAVASKLITELKQIGSIGVKNILLTGVPDVGLIPQYDVDDNHLLDATEAARAATATDYSRYLDNLYRIQVIPALQAAGLNVTYVPLMDYTDSSGTHAGALNAILPELAALNGLPASELSQHLLDHQELVFFDQVHPNAQTHALVTAYANSLLPGGSWVETPLGADVDYSASGSISAAGEVDKLSIAMVAGTTYTFQMLGVSSLTTFSLGQLGLGPTNPSTLLSDTSLQLASPSGMLLESNDDSGMGLDSMLGFTATNTGNYVLSMSAVGTLKGAYVVTASLTGAAMEAGNNYVVNDASTLVLEGVGGVGQDAVLSSVSYALAAGSEIEVLRTTNDEGKGPLNLTGNEFSQTIIGNAGANIFDGKGGADTLYGGAGNDVLSGDAGTDVLYGQADNDTLAGGGGADWLVGGEGDDVFYDTAAGLSGDTITDFARGDRIVIPDAAFAGFTYHLTDNVLTYSGGSVTLSNLHLASIAASLAPEGGVQITFSGPPLIASAGLSVSLANSQSSAAEQTEVAKLAMSAGEADLTPKATSVDFPIQCIQWDVSHMAHDPFLFA